VLNVSPSFDPGEFRRPTLDCDSHDPAHVAITLNKKNRFPVVGPGGSSGRGVGGKLQRAQNPEIAAVYADCADVGLPGLEVTMPNRDRPAVRAESHGPAPIRRGGKDLPLGSGREVEGPHAAGSPTVKCSVIVGQCSQPEWGKP